MSKYENMKKGRRKNILFMTCPYCLNIDKAINYKHLSSNDIDETDFWLCPVCKNYFYTDYGV